MKRFFVSMYTDGPASRWNVVDRRTQEIVRRFSYEHEAQEFAAGMNEDSGFECQIGYIIRLGRADDKTSEQIARDIIAKLALFVPEPHWLEAVTDIKTDIPHEQHWIDQNYQIDRYGVALMMIREGCADPSGLARRILAEFEETPSPVFTKLEG